MLTMATPAGVKLDQPTRLAISHCQGDLIPMETDYSHCTLVQGTAGLGIAGTSLEDEARRPGGGGQ